ASVSTRGATTARQTDFEQVSGFLTLCSEKSSLCLLQKYEKLVRMSSFRKQSFYSNRLFSIRIEMEKYLLFE
ncbi:hypothetical protein GIB67_031758, partial [Kingdonia uniflora]